MLGKLIKIIATLIFLFLLLLILFIILLIFLNDSSPEVSEPLPPQVFTISFDDNGGRLENAFQITDVKVGIYILDAIATYDIIGIKDNHILYGWRLNSPHGVIISNTHVMPANDIILFANWLRNEEEPSPPSLLPGEFRIVNDTLFNGINMLSFVTILEFEKTITITEEVNAIDYVMRLLLDNLTQDAIYYQTTINDLNNWFLVTVNMNNIYIRNNMTDIPFIPQ